MLPFRSFARKRALSVAVGLVVFFAATLASAQQALPMVGDPAWPGLAKDDIDRMSAAAARLYEGHSIGTVERWRNPDSKDAGEVKLVRSFESHGMPCRTLDYTIRFATARNSPDHYVLNWCKIPSGEWKIVELAPPRH